MATEKQIAANRSNAKKSTGPRTPAGKLNSSRNAFRHGFSSPAPLDPATLTKAGAIAHELIGDGSSQDKRQLAVEFVAAQLRLQRIWSKRTELMAKVNLNQLDALELKRLLALDRYERYAQTKRRRAASKF